MAADGILVQKEEQYDLEMFAKYTELELGS